MTNLRDIFENSKKEMFFKELDYFRKLNDKQKESLFYPGMILSLAEYTNYPKEDARDLAIFSQVLYYSIEIHENIFKETENENNDLVILEGDHLYSKTFKKLTMSKHIKDISKVTDYVKTYSEKRIMLIDGLLSEKEVLDYKYKQVSKLITEIIAPDKEELLEITAKLTDLYMLFLKDDILFNGVKDKLIKDSKTNQPEEIQKIILDTIRSIGGE